MEYRLTDLAFGDLAEIYAYIANDPPEAARRFIGKLFDQFAFLAKLPEAGEQATRIPRRRYPRLLRLELRHLLSHSTELRGNHACRSRFSKYRILIRHRRLS